MTMWTRTLAATRRWPRSCNELRARDMRVVLDAVVNHTSERHPWFDRHSENNSENKGEQEAGAYSGEASPTRGFYTFRDAGDPESYVGWYDVRTLPVLDFAHPGGAGACVRGGRRHPAPLAAPRPTASTAGAST